MDKTSSRYAVTVVNEASALIQLTDQGLGNRPASTGADDRSVPDDSNFTALGGSANDGGIFRAPRAGLPTRRRRLTEVRT